MNVSFCTSHSNGIQPLAAAFPIQDTSQSFVPATVAPFLNPDDSEYGSVYESLTKHQRSILNGPVVALYDVFIFLDLLAKEGKLSCPSTDDRETLSQFFIALCTADDLSKKFNEALHAVCLLLERFGSAVLTDRACLAIFSKRLGLNQSESTRAVFMMVCAFASSHGNSIRSLPQEHQPHFERLLREAWADGDFKTGLSQNLITPDLVDRLLRAGFPTCKKYNPLLLCRACWHPFGTLSAEARRELFSQLEEATRTEFAALAHGETIGERPSFFTASQQLGNIKAFFALVHDPEPAQLQLVAKVFQQFMSVDFEKELKGASEEVIRHREELIHEAICLVARLCCGKSVGSTLQLFEPTLIGLIRVGSKHFNILSHLIRGKELYGLLERLKVAGISSGICQEVAQSLFAVRAEVVTSDDEPASRITEEFFLVAMYADLPVQYKDENGMTARIMTLLQEYSQCDSDTEQAAPVLVGLCMLATTCHMDVREEINFVECMSNFLPGFVKNLQSIPLEQTRVRIGAEMLFWLAEVAKRHDISNLEESILSLLATTRSVDGGEISRLNRVILSLGLLAREECLGKIVDTKIYDWFQHLISSCLMEAMLDPFAFHDIAKLLASMASLLESQTIRDTFAKASHAICCRLILRVSQHELTAEQAQDMLCYVDTFERLFEAFETKVIDLPFWVPLTADEHLGYSACIQKLRAIAGD